MNNKFRDRLIRFMQGRYGVDEFEKVLYWIAMAFLIASLIVKSPILQIAVLGLFAYTIYRIISKNIEARRAENRWYLGVREKIVYFFQGGIKQASDKEHVYFRCPKCRQMVRVPRGHGRVEIRCPKCRHKFIRETDR
ncbi:MAG: hypothetical protein UHN88_03265 [Eubacterium sp.]|nr:hypothetical protein [Eubacterium sp.]